MTRRVVAVAFFAAFALLLLFVMRSADEATALKTRELIPDFLLDQPGRDGGQSASSELRRAFATVTCTVSDVHRDAGMLVASTGDGEIETAEAEDRTFSLHLKPGEWRIAWLGIGEMRQLGTLDLSEGDIQRCHLANSWPVTGHVQNVSGQPVANVWVGGCGGQTTTDEHGTFRMEATTGECVIAASLQDGLLERRSDGAQFSPFDAAVEIELELDDGPIAGIGIVISTSLTGVLVEEVKDDTPASEAGLVGGDLVTAVDGKSTEGWSSEAAMAAITGAPGSVVRLDIRREDQFLSLTVRRERL